MSRSPTAGTLLTDAEGRPRPVDEREHATTALTVVLARAGVWGLRVHDVRSCVDALTVVDALDEARDREDHR